ncbi:Seipin-2 [Cardamine amara subsp. amara]|uniref:Seipin-2 n=1 Tax=Cardamine amara subsp. amara TaxID=228776 RepID=A0ABD1AEE0_CARAN
MESSSNLSTTEEFDRFHDAPEEFYYDCSPMCSDSHRQHSSLSRRRRSLPRRDLISPDIETESSSSSIGFEVDGFVENSDELKVDFETIEKDDSDVTESTTDLIDLSPETDDLDTIDSSEDKDKDMDVTDSDCDRVDPFEEKPEESSVTTVNNDREDNNYAGSSPQLREPDSTDWSLLGYLAELVIKAIEFQVSLLTSFLTFPPWFLHYCFLFVFDPFSTIRFGRRFLMARVVMISDMIFGNMSPFKLSWLKDPKQMLNTACKFGWGMFWAFYVGIVLFGLFVSSLMLGGFMINRIADKPFVVKEVLNFDYTKNSPEAYVPISSCAGVACDGSCKESNELSKIRGLRVIPRDHKLEITLSMTLPESAYNKNLGMFQVRVDFLSVDGQTISSIRRPCMLRFRSEPIRLVQTFFKVVPLVTGYVSEIQTLSLKLKGFVEKEIPTACLKIMIEQRAEFRPGAGIPELYDASLSLESDLPLFKKVIWKWRKTLFVWISMSMFITELLFALVCCRPLIIPRTRRRDPTPSPINPMGSR